MARDADVTRELTTLRDYLRWAVSRFEEAGLVYGHGTTDAMDEAAFMVLEGLRLPIDRLDPFLDAKLLPRERERLAGLIEARVETRKPASYLLNKAYIRGVPFYVDERVIVPRSFIGELLFSGLFAGEDGALVDDPDAVESVLDLCAGSGALAILAARVFPYAQIDAVELSHDAADVARRNIAESGAAERLHLLEGDLFAPVKGRRYDLIVTNPPYVDAQAMAELPPEYAHEPAMALGSGEDGLDIVRRILREAADHLTPTGALLCEIGRGRELLEAEFPHLPLLWLDTQESAGEVFFLRAADLQG
ncbi:MAG: SAM-dependent methyltransferase [Hyphomicrobiales bacterium]|nr:SAM-dependent methyltransferase [Hyphomicrobiales bacterium]